MWFAFIEQSLICTYFRAHKTLVVVITCDILFVTTTWPCKIALTYFNCFHFSVYCERDVMWFYLFVLILRIFYQEKVLRNGNVAAIQFLRIRSKVLL